MKSRSVLLLSSVFPPQPGGSGRWLWEVYRRLPRECVAIAAGAHPDAAAFDRTHKLRLERLDLAMPDWGTKSLAGFRRYWRAAAHVMDLVRRQKAVELHCGACLPGGWIAWMLKHRLGLPYVLYMHGEELNYTGSSRELTWMGRRVVQGARLVIANSHNTHAILTREWRVPPERIRLLHPGVDTNYFRPAARDADVRRRLGWGERPVVLTVGRMQPRKGQDMMIRATDLVRRTMPDVLYAIVGDGDDRARLEGLVDELDLRGHVQFVGECSDARLLECYQQCDLFVLANRQVGQDIEGFGMVLLEAQACGKPVLAGASGGTAETMRIPETGITLDCTAPEPLAMTVAELLADQNRRVRMGTAARQWVLEHFDWDALAAQAAQLFGMPLAASAGSLRSDRQAPATDPIAAAAGELE